jgi:hypothetical protein
MDNKSRITKDEARVFVKGFEIFEAPQLYEILVPVATNDGLKILISAHQSWDAEVVSIAGGLSILKTIKGNWKGNREGMIPVRVAATPSQMVTIAKFTLNFYKQDAVMYYKVSDEVHIYTRDNG